LLLTFFHAAVCVVACSTRHSVNPVRHLMVPIAIAVTEITEVTSQNTVHSLAEPSVAPDVSALIPTRFLQL